ncbi:Ig-like domain-containing protein [Candidatus Methanodesulfokora washburnensis]|uniref:Ig-like domain repeat protein n=1 Tax=Candidatus Methanodesulfokora washburnensis TaxID=2478471 RepID=A0A429GPI8_9CREN|nr:Ig-like domain-containing protein [Candidatus Methanodesulfokores washburnensis]RSN75800.1 Ig-like domain repeat protein [Candidatus Methanodesulfokores washburnensis]
MRYAVYLCIALLLVSIYLVTAQPPMAMPGPPPSPPSDGRSGGSCRIGADSDTVAYKGTTRLYIWWEDTSRAQYFIKIYETYPDGSIHESPVLGPYPPLGNAVLVGTFYGDVPGPHFLYFQLTDINGNLLCTSNTIKIDVIRTKEQSFMSLSVTPNYVRIGQSVTVSGSISPGVSAQVKLTIRSPKGESTVEVTSSESGYFSYTISPDSTGLWYVRASWPGNDDYVGSSSGWVSFRVEVPTYQVTIGTSPPGLPFTVDGRNWSETTVFKWDEGSSHIIGVDESISRGDVRYLFTGWSDGDTSPVRTITVRGPLSLTAMFKTVRFYKVTVETSPPMSFLVDGKEYKGRAEFSWGEGSSHTLSVNREIYVREGERYLFTGWSDGDTSPVRTITVRGPLSLTAMFKHQYYFRVESDYGVVSGSGWYDEGATVYAKIDRREGPAEFPYVQVFQGWGGDAKGNDLVSDPVLMNGPKIAKALWKRELSPYLYVLIGVLVAIVLSAAVYLRHRAKTVVKAAETEVKAAEGATVVKEEEKPMEGTLVREMEGTRELSADEIRKYLEKLEELHKKGEIGEDVYRKLKEEYERGIKEAGGSL